MAAERTSRVALARRICALMLMAVFGLLVVGPASAEDMKTYRVAQFPFNIFGGNNSNSQPVTPRPISVTLSASRDINPSLSGSPSPVSVQVFLLRSTGRFQSLDYFQARKGDALSADILDRQSLAVVPGSSVSVSLNAPPAGQAAYVALVAGYRNIDDAQWKTSAPVNAGDSVRGSLSRLSVSVSVTPAAP